MIADIANLIARQGEIQADAAARNAAIWGQTISNLGQMVGNYPQEQLARQEAQQRQQIVQMQLDAAKRQQAANAQIANLPRQADGTFDTGAIAQTLQRNGVDAESSARTLKSLDDLNGIITKANQTHLDHLADVAQLLLANATPTHPVTVDDVHRAFAAVKPIPSFGLTDADEQWIVGQMGQGADPRQWLTAIRDQGTTYKAARAKLMEPQKLGPGDIVGIPGTGQTILENPKAPPLPTAASLAADAATLGTPNETPTAKQSKAALDALQAPEMATRADVEAGQRETARHNRAEEANAAARLRADLGPLGTSPGSPGSTLTGEDYLKTLSPSVATEVKAYAEGRRPFPTGYALKSPYFQKLIQMVGQYDPSFDAVNYNGRNKARLDFTAGKSAQQITALNTVIGHLGDLDAKSGALGNTSVQSYNAIKNWLKTQTGSADVTNFNTVKKGVTDELTRVWRQAGGSEQDIKTWAESLNAAQSPDQLTGAFKTIAGMLSARLDALENQKQQGLGRFGNDIQIITPQSQQILQRLAGSSAPPAPSTAPPNGQYLMRKFGATYKWDGSKYVKQ